MESTIDLTFLNGFASGDGEKMKKYINMFLKSSPALLEQINQNMETQNWTNVKIAAHSLKPQVNYMGIAEIKDDILLIEQLSGEERDLDKLPDLVKKVEVVLAQSFDDLKSAMEEL